ncbi:A24 family peptidase [Hahella sp. CR1]|uniref:prepilin peptidase n=1 Tax=Hahella sp. CR1 TaxID=2992807 RepID=UPI00244101BF|nr:A24 family peptidase [Hahella sp. CR1]MDG9668248.1 A24 family peptidase [Hahella sp. CR1]
MLEIFNQFNHNPALLYTTVIVFGLVVGSFLNVVILRKPKMLEQEWRAQCAEIPGCDCPKIDEPLITLSKPDSTCPKCGHKIRAWENIPVISYLFLGGKCSSCKTGISIRYPLVEIATALLAVIAVCYFKMSWAGLAAIGLSWTLLTLSLIDFDTQLLPDDLTLPLLWAGLLINIQGIFAPLSEAVIGAVIGYLALWSVYHLFRLLTGKEGMGYGDFKLLAALGAWLGWKMLPLIILLSSLVGAVIGLAMIITLGRDKNIPIPFGPYLAIAGWIAMIWGNDIVSAYLGMYPAP